LFTNRAELDFKRPGKQSDNALAEAINARFRQERLNQHHILSMEDARAKISASQYECNTERPHSALDYHLPIQSEPVSTDNDAVAA
jgi:putative transposase